MCKKSVVLIYSRKTSSVATVNYIICQWLLSSGEALSIAAGRDFRQSTQMNLCPKEDRKPDQKFHVQLHLMITFLISFAQHPWMQVHVEIAMIFFQMLNCKLVYNCN